MMGLFPFKGEMKMGRDRGEDFGGKHDVRGKEEKKSG